MLEWRFFQFATKRCLHLSQNSVFAECHSRVNFLWRSSNLLEKGSVREVPNSLHRPKYKPHCFTGKGDGCFLLNTVLSRQCRCYKHVVFRLHFATGRFPGTGGRQPSLQNYWGVFCLLLHVCCHCGRMMGITQHTQSSSWPVVFVFCMCIIGYGYLFYSSKP